MFRVGFVIPKPLCPKHRSTFLPLQHAATLILSVDWGLTTAAGIQLATPRYFVEHWKESFGDPTESMARGDATRNRVGGGQSGGPELPSEVSVSAWSHWTFLFCTRMRGDTDDDWHWAWSKKYPCLTVVRRPPLFAERLGIDFGKWLLSENVCKPDFELTVDHGAVRYTSYKPPIQRDRDWRQHAPWFEDPTYQDENEYRFVVKVTPVSQEDATILNDIVTPRPPVSTQLRSLVGAAGQWPRFS